MNSIELLRRAGYAVDVFKCRYGDNYDSLGDSACFDDGVTWYLMPLRRVGYGVQRVLRWLRFARWIARHSKGKRYSCFLAVDHAGLITASWVALWHKVPVIYYSLELWIAKDQKKRITLASLENSLERWAHRRAWFTIIQDEFRAAALGRENGVPTDNMMLVPHSPMGEAYYGERTYLRKKFRLPLTQKILLSAGSINSTNLSLELAQAAREWPPDWTLILHGRLSSNQAYNDSLFRLADGRRVIVSSEQVAYQDLPKLMGSADVGLALYPKHDTNYFLTASGKLADYTRCGLPVVATDLPNLVRMMAAYDFGRCVSSAAEVKDAVVEILADYPRYRTNSFRCYTEHLEYSQAFQKVLAKIATIV